MRSLVPRIVALIFVLCASIYHSKATLHIIEADSVFTQPFDTILVGDTVKWVWVSGNHTTTSNGIPTLAMPWNELLDEHHPVFTYVVSIPGTYNYISVPDAPGMKGSFVAIYPVGIAEPQSIVSDFRISGNPSRNNISFSLMLTQAVTGEVSLYNLAGAKIQTLYSGEFLPVYFQRNIQLSKAISPGLYFVALKTGDISVARKIVIQ